MARTKQTARKSTGDSAKQQRANAAKADQAGVKKRKIGDAIRSIKQQQREASESFAIRKLPFSRLVREIVGEILGKQIFRFATDAMEALQASAEHFLVIIMEILQSNAVLAKRVTVMPQDMHHFLKNQPKILQLGTPLGLNAVREAIASNSHVKFGNAASKQVSERTLLSVQKRIDALRDVPIKKTTLKELKADYEYHAKNMHKWKDWWNDKDNEELRTRTVNEVIAKNNNLEKVQTLRKYMTLRSFYLGAYERLKEALKPPVGQQSEQFKAHTRTFIAPIIFVKGQFPADANVYERPGQQQPKYVLPALVELQKRNAADDEDDDAADDEDDEADEKPKASIRGIPAAAQKKKRKVESDSDEEATDSDKDEASDAKPDRKKAKTSAGKKRKIAKKAKPAALQTKAERKFVPPGSGVKPAPDDDAANDSDDDDVKKSDQEATSDSDDDESSPRPSIRGVPASDRKLPIKAPKPRPQFGGKAPVSAGINAAKKFIERTERNDDAKPANREGDAGDKDADPGVVGAAASAADSVEERDKDAQAAAAEAAAPGEPDAAAAGNAEAEVNAPSEPEAAAADGAYAEAVVAEEVLDEGNVNDAADQVSVQGGNDQVLQDGGAAGDASMDVETKARVDGAMAVDDQSASGAAMAVDEPVDKVEEKMEIEDPKLQESMEAARVAAAAAEDAVKHLPASPQRRQPSRQARQLKKTQ